MSALADNVPHIRAMGEVDLHAVTAIETAIYTHPWTHGNFLDSVRAGYDCRVMEVAGELVGYGVQMIGVRESHLLNLSIAEKWQGNGYGRTLLMHFLDVARQSDVLQILLEVRRSNEVGRRLYASAGFQEIALRRGYYPAAHGREDAILLVLIL
jgi:[ribosomal protein S18]-alanine N-acetyltransferase